MKWKVRGIGSEHEVSAETTAEGLAVTVDGEEALVVPLSEGRAAARAVAERLARARPQRGGAFAREARAAGILRAESDSYLYTVPRSGVSHFQRLWPTASVIDTRTPDGVRGRDPL